MFPMLDRALGLLPSDIRAMILKDARVLFRDPVQWTQGLLFFGLLGLYFMNLRHLRYHMLSDVWRNLVVFLNVFSLSAVMCSFCSRFVYPQLSLEGHGFWMLGLAPTTMGRVLLAKFISAVAGMLLLSAVLMSVSTGMLRVAPETRLVVFAIAASMSIALPGLATGLGAVFIDLKQRNPMAIISGFGGTLNLVLNLVFMSLAVFPFAWLFHRKALGHIRADGMMFGQTLAFVWLVCITLLATLTPLLIGRRSLAAREY